MEKLFRPGKLFVGFCALFLVVWGLLQYVSNSRLEEEARLAAHNVFTWSWPRNDSDLSSQAEISETSIVKKSDVDAIVFVKGKQVLTVSPKAGEGAKPKSESVDCAARLTFYRMSHKNKDLWVLGKVEFQ